MKTYKQFLLENTSYPPETLRFPAKAFHYASDILGGPFPEGEQIIATSPDFSYRYASEVLGGRFPLGEKAVLQDPNVAYSYTKYVIDDRWPEAEDLLRTDRRYWDIYVRFLSGHALSREDWEKDVWTWLKDPKYNMENTIEILNIADYYSEYGYGSTDAMHEYICQHRPDLINKIWEIDSELAKKYQHETELGNLDV